MTRWKRLPFRHRLSKTSRESLKLDSLKITDANPVANTNNIDIVEYESDLFIFYSTLPNHSSFAFLDTNEGTYFLDNNEGTY